MLLFLKNTAIKTNINRLRKETDKAIYLLYSKKKTHSWKLFFFFVLKNKYFGNLKE